jgi:high-affinity nickel-transport protein
MAAPLNFALFSCAVLGFRHGFDYDHIAAITDITGVQQRASRAMRLGLMYALGHALTVAALGCAVILFQFSLPAGMDRWAERIVGVTLIVLAIYVLSRLAFHKEHPQSRAAIMIGAGQWLHSWFESWRTGAPRKVTQPLDVNQRSCFGIGVIHGLGAETPSQLAVFLLAANLGGPSKGFLGLGVFLTGLLTMNTLMTASAAGIFRAGRNWPMWLPFLTGLTAVYSFCIGLVLLFGFTHLLPAIAG